MLLNEIPVGSAVTLTAVTKSGSVDFEVTSLGHCGYIKKYGYGISIDILRQDGKVISLGGARLSCEIINIDDNRLYKYKITAIGYNKERTHLCLYSQDDVKPVNNRTAYRVSCGYQATVRISSHTGTIQGFLHDISMTGASYALPKESLNVAVGNRVSATVFDTQAGINYKQEGNIVRVQEDYSKDLLLIGVQFKETTGSITHLVTSLQQKDLRIRRDEKA